MRVISGSARGTTLHSIEDITTRPTLDRVKESLFNIINSKIDEETICLDLFAGSGAIGIEFLSRGAKEVLFCDKTKKAVDMIKQNLTKTRLLEKAKIYNIEYKECLKFIKDINKKIDIVYIDPPYKENIGIEAIKNISTLNILKENGIIIIETDEKERELEEIKKYDIRYEVYDIRKYGRAYLIFLK